VPRRSCLKGILSNLIGPHTWLFWLTVGAAKAEHHVDLDRPDSYLLGEAHDRVPGKAALDMTAEVPTSAGV
jgi:hypothetical protein